MSLNTIGTTAYCDTEWSGATFDLEEDSEESSDGYSYGSSSPTTSIGVSRVYHTPAPKYASPPPPKPVQPQVVHVKQSIRNPSFPPPPTYVSSPPKKGPSSRVPLKYEGSQSADVDAKYHRGNSQRLGSASSSAKSIPPPVPATPPVTVSQKQNQKVHQNPLAKTPVRVAPNAKKVEPVRWAANGDMIPGQDPNYFIEGGVYVPQYYHEQLWRCPSLKPRLNIPDPKGPPVQSHRPASGNEDSFDSTMKSSEDDEYATPRIKEVDTVSIALSANLGDESLRTLSKEQRKKAEQNLKTILVNQKLLQTRNQREKSQKEEEAKQNAENILNTLRKKQAADEIAEKRRREREARKKKAEQKKRDKEFQRKLEKAKRQKEKEQRERERRSSSYSDRSQKSHNGFDEAQAEEARRLLKEVKRLSEEKAILTLQRNSSGSSTRLEETVQAGAGVTPKRDSASGESFSSELSAVVEEPSVAHTVEKSPTPEIAQSPPIPPQRNLSTQSHEVTPPPPEYENAKPRPSVDSMGSSQSKKMVIPNHNGDNSVKVLSYKRTDKTQAAAPTHNMTAVPVRNQLSSSSEDERFTSEDESTIRDDPPPKPIGVTAGVQTGRDSIITKAKISPPRESLNLSDLSDEEVDRLTQLGLSFGPSKVTGQRLTQDSQVSIFSL
ncbi:Oidioi.mRNA.OKI2018_I69.chr2.g6478.t1.cds [Oikopleura dioica]|uniref:Oidioi.mRNA.OKI2018_I69.chr2.g6478.t1.cds n=1 Tax=Oikopleura dioica TaxID=34765 RepID=A0ABN7T3T4_OIKDI|nr:Oidioi.mRNA.OKI2018_I69.chr2.g6478.t1.cds [Oikopleura dioica]